MNAKQCPTMPEPITRADIDRWSLASEILSEQKPSVQGSYESVKAMECAREALPRLLARVADLEAGLTDLINKSPDFARCETIQALRKRCHQILQGPKQEVPTRKHGVPSRPEAYKILKAHSLALQSGEVKK